MCLQHVQALNIYLFGLQAWLGVHFRLSTARKHFSISLFSHSHEKAIRQCITSLHPVWKNCTQLYIALKLYKSSDKSLQKPI